MRNSNLTCRLAALLLFLSVAAPGVAAELLPADKPVANAIDHYVDAKLKAAGVKPAPQADDATLVRRLSLDLAGRIPTAAEAKDYVGSSDPNKRQQFIDRLVSSAWYERHIATELNFVLSGADGNGPDLRKYLLAAVKENRPWNRMIRELLGEEPDANGAEQFVIKRLSDQDLLARDVSSIFFGVNVTCCQCHTHPYISTLTQDYFYGMKAFFSRSYEFQGKLLERRFSPKMTFKNRAGESREVGMMFLSGEKPEMPDLGVPDLAKAIAEESKEIEALKKDFAKNKAYPPAAPFSPRSELLKVVGQPQNQLLLARSLVNRLWFRLWGHGLVMRVDQMHSENPGSHPELLDWLARDLVTHNWDMRRTVRGLAGSQAYSRSSRWTGPAPEKELFAVAELRPLSAPQFGMSALFIGDASFEKPDLTPEALATQIEALEKRGLAFSGTLFEPPQLEGFQINVSEPLSLSNDPGRLKQIGAALVPSLLKLDDPGEQVEAATWSVLSRPPTAEEAAVLREFLSSAPPSDDPKTQADQRRKALEQIVWAFVAGPEFRFNH